MTFDHNLPVRTRSGMSARIVCSDRKGILPILALVEIDSGECAYAYNTDGRLGVTTNNHPYDLVNIEEPAPAAPTVPTLDLAKPVRLSNGTPIRILATDAPGDRPVIGMTDKGDVIKFTADGDDQFSPHRLVQTPLRGTKWLNVWTTGRPKDATSYNSRQDADDAAAKVEARPSPPNRRLACIEVAWEEGQGL